MDVFVGARMHATLAAYSSGVAAIPFSYSRKFEGLYESLEYPFVISGTKMTTDDALEKTVEYIRSPEKLMAGIENYLPVLEEKKQKMMKDYTRIITDLCNNDN